MSDNMIWNPAIDDDPGFSTAPTDRARAGAHATPSPMVEPPRSIADVVAALTTDGFVEVLA